MPKLKNNPKVTTEIIISATIETIIQANFTTCNAKNPKLPLISNSKDDKYAMGDETISLYS